MLQVSNNQNYSSVPTFDYNTVPARGLMLDKVYSMRYKSYRDDGYIDECSSRMFIDEYDERENCTSYLLYYGSKAVASMRSCLYEPNSRLDVPVSTIYKDEIEQALPQDSSYLEVNKFVVDPRFQGRGGLKARFQLFRLMTELAQESEASSIVLAVRPEHVRFYKMFKCNPISDAKIYPHLNFKTVLLACTEIDEAQEFMNSKLGGKKIGNKSIPNYCVN